MLPISPIKSIHSPRISITPTEKHILKVPSTKQDKVNLDAAIYSKDSTSDSNTSLYDKIGGNTLRKSFSFWSILGVGFGLTNSWCGISASMVAGISTGGCMVIVYGIIIVAVVSIGVAATLSELTSAIPNAGGQYMWTKLLAPKKHAPFWAFLCGQLAWIGSVFTVASMAISLGTMVTSMYKLTHPGFEVKDWHIFVAAELLHWFTFLFNCKQTWLPYIASFALYFSILSWLTISITVLGCSKGDFQPASFVFKDFNNQTGWSSAGIAFITGLINPAWSFSCLDSATHMAEEVMKPEVVIPQAVMSTVAIGFVTAFSYVVAMFFWWCIGSVCYGVCLTSGL
ncbi:unnamed protein product [Ambrosiozyma monospora]|uniref:Unnamed protein product n=1 Tax=Ambrosiozyma monospora TaxID=43982 RepID=A0ACB5TLC3_AMBMO|nr:unnamed protein product [Ambrosiozyma monospora]